MQTNINYTTIESQTRVLILFESVGETADVNA